MTYETLFAALGDPTRRGIFERLRRREHAVGELAGLSSVSQPAVSQHLRVLREAGLVSQRREGVRRLYRAAPEGLEALRAWVETGWDEVLTAFADPDSGKGANAA